MGFSTEKSVRLFAKCDGVNCSRTLSLVGPNEAEVRGQLVETGWKISGATGATCPQCITRPAAKGVAWPGQGEGKRPKGKV